MEMYDLLNVNSAGGGGGSIFQIKFKLINLRKNVSAQYEYTSIHPTPN